jgi:hypothetical protein
MQELETIQSTEVLNHKGEQLGNNNGSLKETFVFLKVWR